jgi:hypothetical protein
MKLLHYLGLPMCLPYSNSFINYVSTCLQTCIDCKGRKEEVTYLRDKLVKDKKIEKLKSLLDDQTK